MMTLVLLIGGQGREDLFRFTAKVVVEEGEKGATYMEAVTATKDCKLMRLQND